MSDETDKSSAPDLGDGFPGQPGSGTTAGAQDPVSSAEELVPSEWTTEQVSEWREKASKSQEYWDRLVRISADFDNYKKRAARERQEAVRYANESLLEKLIPILDSLDMALAAPNNTQNTTADALKTGVSMIQSQLRNVLTEAGLEEIDAAGKAFDPNWHEAVSAQPSNEVPEGQVLQQMRKGFKLRDRLIRPATVVVAKKAGT